MATAGMWVSGARPRTLPAALAPVAAGTGAAAHLDGLVPGRALLALVVALALQVGVNYANDYSDGVRGTDADRVGPFRLTGSGAARPGSVRTAALLAFTVAALAGLLLVALCGQWWLLGVGALSIVAAWYYTGGRRPYGYAGFGEVFVFVFFGLVAVLGTTYTQAGRVSLGAVCAATGVGALACAILVANNLRDLPTDASAGKRTLAVRLGDARTRTLYRGLLLAAPLSLLPLLATTPWVLVVVPALLLAARPAAAVGAGARGTALLPVLRDTGRFALGFGVLTGVALALAG